MLRKTMAVVALVLCAWTVRAEAQWGPRGGGMGPRGGGMGGGEEMRARFEEMRGRMEAMNALNLEAMWAVLTFGIGATPEQLDPLRGPFGGMWAKRATILEDAKKGGKTDWGAIKDEFKDMKKELDPKIKALLKEDQHKEFSRQMKSYERDVPQMPGGGFGGRRGGFGTPGGGSGPLEGE